MLMMVCDRCGQTTEFVVKLSYYTDQNWRQAHVPHLESRQRAMGAAAGSIAESFDLCFDCAHKLRAFLHELKDDAGEESDYIFENLEEDEVND